MKLGLGLGLNRAGNISAMNRYVYLLDKYPNAVQAISSRLLSTTYIGQCLRVRRSSDNTELDIGFVDNYMDYVSMATFVGAGNGFVVKRYDQSGNGKHMVQSNAAEQPIIISGGVLQIFNIWVCDVYNGTKALLSPSVVSAYPFSAFMVAADAGGVGFLCGGSEDTSSNFINYGHGINYGGTGSILREVDGATARSVTAGAAIPNTMRQASYIHIDATNKRTTIDGAIATSNLFSGSCFPVDNSCIGAIYRPVPIYGGGWFAEYIVYASNKSSDEAAISVIQKDYFGTPLSP